MVHLVKRALDHGLQPEVATRFRGILAGIWQGQQWVSAMSEGTCESQQIHHQVTRNTGKETKGSALRAVQLDFKGKTGH